jgi:hypothetical protein
MVTVVTDKKESVPKFDKGNCNPVQRKAFMAQTGIAVSALTARQTGKPKGLIFDSCAFDHTGSD